MKTTMEYMVGNTAVQIVNTGKRIKVIDIKKEKKQVANIEEHWGEIASSRECQLTDEDLQILKDFIKDL